MAKKIITGPFPERAGFASPNHAVPYYRWVPPASFADYVPLPERSYGTMTTGPRSIGPSYQSPPESNCPACMHGVGEATVEEDFQGSVRYLLIAAAVLTAGVLLTRVADRGGQRLRRNRPRSRPVFGA